MNRADLVAITKQFRAIRARIPERGYLDRDTEQLIQQTGAGAFWTAIGNITVGLNQAEGHVLFLLGNASLDIDHGLDLDAAFREMYGDGDCL